MNEAYDIIILGCGPAGVSAALYAGRSNLRTLIIGGSDSALMKAEKIQNFYGATETPSGRALFEKGLEQLRALGIERADEEVINIDYFDDYCVQTNENREYRARALIVCTGAKRIKANIGNFERFEGAGLSYCAVCDAFFYRQKEVAVLGSGAYALHEINALLPTAKKVSLLTNGETPSVEFPMEVEIIEKKIASLEGEAVLESVVFEDGEKLALNGFFVALGVAGASDLARKLGVEVRGADIVTDESMATMLPGLYAAGDCTGGVLQVSVAVAEGARAALSAISYIRKLK